MSAPAKTRMDPSEYDWDAAEFEMMLLSKHYSPLAGRDIEAITVHHMTIVGDGDGDALVSCYNTWQNREASAHYGVDGDFVAQYVWDKDFAWATASNWGNLRTISIEHTNRTAGPNWTVDEKTWKTGAKLAAYLHKIYKLGRPTSTGFGAGGTLRTHQSFYATSCPGPYFKSIWAAYVKEVQRVYDLITGKVTPKPEPVPTAKTYTVKGGDTLWAISAKYNVTVADLAKWNSIARPYIIQPGQVLRLTATSTPVDPKPPVTPPKPQTATFKVLLLPTAGYNAPGAKGVTQWAKNTRGLAALVNRLKPDVVGTTELSNRGIDPMLPLFDSLVGLVRLPGGTDGRYLYREGSTTNLIVSGNVSTSEATEFNDDDKQGAWGVLEDEDTGARKGFVVVHTENEDGVDKSGPNKGEDADDLRVGQTTSMLGRALTAMAPYGITSSDVLYMGDFNSNKMVRDKMVSLGWTPIGPGYFTRWDDSAKETFDWGFIKDGTATFERINHDFGDHTALLMTWTVPV